MEFRREVLIMSVGLFVIVVTLSAILGLFSRQVLKSESEKPALAPEHPADEGQNTESSHTQPHAV